MIEKRKNGLCMWCGVKFIAGHQCVKSQLYHMSVESEPDNDVEIEEFSDCVDYLEDLTGAQPVESDKLVISLHVLFGTEGYQTM